MRIPELELVTKRDCHLCDEARRVLERVSGESGVPWTERLIDEDPELRRRFAEEVPVVLVDGVQRDFWKIDEARLLRTLAKAGAEGTETR